MGGLANQKAKAIPKADQGGLVGGYLMVLTASASHPMHRNLGCPKSEERVP